jgi:hypothetical protein
MSALPQKADMVQHNRDVRFVPQYRHSALRRRLTLFDQLVGAAEYRRRNGKTLCLSGLEINH